jgi:hypothetical protein
MTEFKGTKGKWTVSELNFDEIKSESGFSIADVWDMGIERFPNPDEANANALLISKAPEMLEMLGKCISMLGNVGEFEMAKEIQHLIKEATG